MRGAPTSHGSAGAHPCGRAPAPATLAGMTSDPVEYPQGSEFPGVIGRTVEESSPAWPAPIRARDGAPNVLFVVLDDVGYGQLSCFGGMVETPNIDRVAASGLRYANMHTTALCSPTRACILTGRNHHSSGVACIMELATGYPGYDGRMPFENGMVSEMLAAGAATTRSASASGTSRRRRRTRPPARCTAGRSAAGSSASTASSAARPTSGIRTSRSTTARRSSRSTPEEGYHLSEDLTDQAIKFVLDAHVNAPEKPFFMYYAPGCAHAPHHVPREWADRYAGKFDGGWDAYREAGLRAPAGARAPARRRAALAARPGRARSGRRCPPTSSGCTRG